MWVNDSFYFPIKEGFPQGDPSLFLMRSDKISKLYSNFVRFYTS
jgi:hypothetical protein